MIVRPMLIAAVVLAGARPVEQQPPRDATGAAIAGGSISGVVLVDGQTSRPARRVRVTLTELGRSVPGQTTTTDDRGAFTFRQLPAGRFELQAFKNAYLRASYGAARPERPGTPVVLKDGEAVTGLRIPIVRGGVITGVVRDAKGKPLPGLNARVLRVAYNALTGERTLVSPSSGSSTVTDDRGEYRAYGLPPGRYYVLVPPPPSGGRGDEELRRLTSEDVRRALQAARSSTSAAPGTGVPIAGPALLARVNYAPVFHPGAADIATATPVTLGLGEERGGIDVAIQLVPTARVIVTVSSESGTPPPSLAVRLQPAGEESAMLAGAGIRGVTAQPQGDGRYIFSGVGPGTYTAMAQFGGSGRGAGPFPPLQWAAAEVHVTGQDQSVALTLQPGVPINGRVVFEGAQPTSAELEGLAFLLAAPSSGGELLTAGGGRVNREGRFTFAGVIPNSYRFSHAWNAAGAGNRWTLKAASANGREAFEAPLRVSANEPVEWTVTFTDTPTTLTGRFEGGDGRPATEYYVLVFPADRAHWTPGSRRIRTARPATDGEFTVKGLPAGDYCLVALPDLEPGEWNDAAFLEQLVKASTKVTLRDGETTKQNYRLGG